MGFVIILSYHVSAVLSLNEYALFQSSSVYPYKVIVEMGVFCQWLGLVFGIKVPWPWTCIFGKMEQGLQCSVSLTPMLAGCCCNRGQIQLSSHKAWSPLYEWKGERKNWLSSFLTPKQAWKVFWPMLLSPSLTLIQHLCRGLMLLKQAVPSGWTAQKHWSFIDLQ